MPIKSRPRLFVASALFAVAASAEAPVLRSTTFSWEEIQAKPAPNGRSRSLFRSATATLDELEIHVKNVGDTPATYHVMQWFSPGMKKKVETK